MLVPGKGSAIASSSTPCFTRAFRVLESSASITTAPPLWSGRRIVAAARKSASPASGTTPASRARPSPSAWRGGRQRRRLRLRRLLRQAALEVRRLLETYFGFAPTRLPIVPLRSRSGCARSFPESAARRAAGARAASTTGKPRSSPSTTSHAASAFFPSPFEEAAILTLDGVGEWATTTCRHRQGEQHPQIDQGYPLPALARACSTRRSPISPASRSTRASTS